MSVDTGATALAETQDEVKKIGDMSTEDESSQDSKTDTKEPTDNGDVKSPSRESEDKKDDANPSDDASAENEKVDSVDLKTETEEDKIKSEKKGENGETHEDDEEKEKKPNNIKKRKPKKEETEEDEDEEEEEDDEDEDGDVKPEKKPITKKRIKKDGDDDKDEEVDEDEEGEEEEEDEEEHEKQPKPVKKKEPSEPPVPVPAGKGIPLGHIPNVEIAISRFKIEDLKFMHQFLYKQICRTNLIKRNIKKFKGYEYDKDSSEYKLKIDETQKLEPKQLRMLCEMLDLDKRGGPNDLATRIVSFLVLPKNSSPHSRGAVKERLTSEHGATPGGRPRRSAAVKVHNRGYSDEEYETDPETKVRGPKVAKDDSADSDGSYNPSGSGQDPDSDFDPNSEDVGAAVRKRKTPGRRPGKPGKKRGRPKKGGKPAKITAKRVRGRKAAQSESEDDSESESGSEQSESENQDSDPLTQEPPAKKGRGAVAGRGRRPAAAVKKTKPTAVKRKGSAPTSAAKKRKQSSSEEDSEGSEEGSEEDEGTSEEGSEEEQQTSTKKGKQPPTDDEIKKYVKQILEGANLEEITMKTVCKQVYSHYPDFDLAHKKDFIKATVKSLISS